MRRLVCRIRGDGTDARKRQDREPDQWWWIRLGSNVLLLAWRTALLVMEWLQEHWL